MPTSRSGWVGDAIVVFVFYGCVVVQRALALLCTFSCSHKTKNKGTLVLAIYQLSFETIGRLCSGIGGQQLGVGPSLKKSQNRHLLEMMRLFSLRIGNAISIL